MWLVVAILILTAVIDYLLAQGWWPVAIPFALMLVCVAQDVPSTEAVSVLKVTHP